MTEEAQRIACAESQGWRPPDDCTRTPNHKWFNPVDGCCYDSLPDYDDLNVMRELEKTLTDDEADDKFYYWLGYVVSGGQETQLWEYRKLIVHASAAQRREAYLRCKGLWQDSKPE